MSKRNQLPQRRANDERLNQVIVDVATLQKQVAENTRITNDSAILTRQVRDILRSFHILGVIAKWVAAIAAGVAAVYHGMEWLKK